MAFIHPIGSGGGSLTITASGVDQTLTAGGGADTLIGYSGGSDVFRGTALGLNGDTIGNLLSSDKIDITDMGFGAAMLTATASGSNTLVTVTSGANAFGFYFGGQLLGCWICAGIGRPCGDVALHIVDVSPAPADDCQVGWWAFLSKPCHAGVHARA